VYAAGRRARSTAGKNGQVRERVTIPLKDLDADER
jgi:hypothetical protein